MDIFAILSLLLLVATILLGFFRKINVGVVAFAMAFVLARLAGIADSGVMGGFSGTLFLRLFGITFLFSIAQQNNTLDKVTKRIISLFRKTPQMIPIVIWLLSAFLAGTAGTIPTFALMATIGCSISYQLHISPIKLVVFGIFGSLGGAMTPVSMNGTIVGGLAAESGIVMNYAGSLATGMFTNGIVLLLFYFATGWHKIKIDSSIDTGDTGSFNRNQIITMFGLLFMIVLTVILQVDVALSALTAAFLLCVCRVTDEKAAISGVPWGTIIMVTGMGAFISLVGSLGGIDIIADALSAIMTERTATPILNLIAGLMSVVSSAQGVVYPTLIPTIPALVESMPALNEHALLMSVVMGAGPTSISPFSTGGALVMGAFSTIYKPNDEERNKMFLYLLGAAFYGLLVLTVLAFFGAYAIFF